MNVSLPLKNILKAVGLVVFFLFFASFALAEDRYVPTIDEMMADLLNQVDDSGRIHEEFEVVDEGFADLAERRAALEREYAVLLDWAWESENSREDIAARLREINFELSFLK